MTPLEKYLQLCRQLSKVKTSDEERRVVEYMDYWWERMSEVDKIEASIREEALCY